MPDTETRTGKFTLGRTLPFAESAPALVPLPDTPSLPGACANCGTELAGPYCAQCGQHVADYHRSLRRFLTDFLDNTICWDNKLLRTLEPLFKQPGFLTREFMAGRRVRYVHPLRLFLFTSAVCLALLQFNHDHLNNAETPGKSATTGNSRDFQWVSSDDPEPLIKAAPTPDASLPLATATPTAADKDEDEDAAGKIARNAIKLALAGDAGKAGGAGREAGKTADEMGRRIGKALEAKIARAGGNRELNKKISEGVQQKLSWVALALLPVFAMGLRAVYWRHDSYYFVHLIFSLHYHTFLLLFWTAYSWLGTGLHSFIFLNDLSGLFLLLVPVYLFVALRQVYGGSAYRTWIKVLVLGGMHLLAIVCALGAIGALSFFSAVQ